MARVTKKNKKKAKMGDTTWVNKSGKSLSKTKTKDHLILEQGEFEIEWVKIDSIKLWEDNPRFNDEASKKLSLIIKDHGIKSPIVCWDKNRTIYKGNTTYKACKLLGIKKVPVVFHAFSSEVAAKAYGIADNKSNDFSDWDEDVLIGMMKSKELQNTNLDMGFTSNELNLLNHVDDDDDDDEALYTAKVESPVYEVTGKKPAVSALYNDTKTKKLISDIKKADIPKDIQKFLLRAATRHVVFDYANIAEFYAHSDKEIQGLMEDSALIIIDYDKAIELGYVKLTKRLGNIADKDSGENV